MVTMTQTFDAKAFVKVRCSTDGEPTLITWRGSVHALIPGRLRQRLFRIVGLSVGKCLDMGDGSWEFVSRELTYYLHPETQDMVHTWRNPWTGEEVPVMHIANNFVARHFRGEFPAEVEEGNATFLLDIFPTYPNPLANNPQFSPYSPNPVYQAAELFKFTVPVADLLDADKPSVSWLLLAWDRVSPWLPWMKMGPEAGSLVYSACGRKVSDFSELPSWLQTELETRLPIYKSPPDLDLERPDMTSWLYFQNHFEAYLRGDRFPLPEFQDS